MRTVLRKTFPKESQSSSHVGLAYGSLAPSADDGKIPDGERAQWIAQLANQSVSPDYNVAFKRWSSSFSLPGDRYFNLRLVSRLLVGHGNASATEVGLTVHHTWGVPVIPGTALKGLLAHYVDAVYGPDNPNLAPWEQPEGDEGDRVHWQGISWQGGRVLRGPGKYYRELFGAPDALDDLEMQKHGLAAGATAGRVIFHDAIYVPDSGIPFATDVLTVHHKNYYDKDGKSWPNDFDSPNPVSFLTIRPQIDLLFALSGPPELTELAEKLLRDALKEWGIGGKTSSGYGRFDVPKAESSSRPSQIAKKNPQFKPGDPITVTRIEDQKKVKFKASDGLTGHFIGEPPAGALVNIGQSLKVWVANVGHDTYTLTLKDPSAKGKNAKR